MPSIHISPNANTSNPLFNCPDALKTHFTQCQHLTAPLQLPSCPQNIFHTVPTPQTPFSTAPMPSKHISHSANTSNPLFNYQPRIGVIGGARISASFEVLASFLRIYREISVLIVFPTQIGISSLYDLVFSRSPHFLFYLFQNSSTDLVRRRLVNRRIMLIVSKCLR